MDIGTNIKAARLKAGLTQAQLAKASGMSQPTIAMYENDQQMPVAKSLAAIAKVLSVPMDSLVEGALPPLTAEETKHHIHGNSTKALVQKILDQLGVEHQRSVLAHAKALLKAEQAEKALRATEPEKLKKSSDTPKHPRKRAA